MLEARAEAEEGAARSARLRAGAPCDWRAARLRTPPEVGKAEGAPPPAYLMVLYLAGPVALGVGRCRVCGFSSATDKAFIGTRMSRAQGDIEAGVLTRLTQGSNRPGPTWGRRV